MELSLKRLDSVQLPLIFSLILTLILKYRPSVKPHCKHSLRSQQSLACTFSSYILILIILSFYFCKLGILLQCEKYIMLLLNRQRKMARTFYPKPARKWRSMLLDDKHKAIKQSKSQCVMLTEAFRILKRVGFYCSHRVHFFHFFFFKQFCFLNSIINRRLKLDISNYQTMQNADPKTKYFYICSTEYQPFFYQRVQVSFGC